MLDNRSYTRQLEQVSLKLLSEESFPFLDFEWEALVLLALVDEIHQTNVGEISLLNRHLASHGNVLGGVTSAALRQLSRLLINASRDLMERNFLDRLEDSLERIALALDHSRAWSGVEERVWDVVSSTITSLSDALLAVCEDQSLEDDLFALVKEAADSAAYSPNMKQAVDEFSRFYVGTYASTRSSFWSSVEPLITGLVTAFRKSSEISLLDGRSNGLKIFSLTESLTRNTRTQFLSLEEQREVMGQISREHSLSFFLPSFVRRAAVESVLGSSEEAVRRLSEWSLSVFSWERGDHELRDFCKRFLKAFPESPLRAEMMLFADWIPRLQLHRGLWFQADEIGRDAAVEVYQAMPGYAQTTGPEEGLGKCARDSAFALRKLALALSPEVTDPTETFGNSWRSLIDAYVHNRPSGLFSRTAEILIQATSEWLGEEFASLVGQTLKPVYEEAEAQATDQVESYQFPQVKAILKRLASSREKEGVTAALKESLTALPLPDLQQKKQAELFLVETIPSSLSGFVSSGHLSSRTLDKLRSFVEAAPSQDAAKLEVYLAGLRFSVGTELEPAERRLVLSMLQTCVEDLRLMRLGREILSRREQLSKQLSPGFILALAQPLGEGPAVWARFESLCRAMHVLAESERGEAETLKSLESLTWWAGKHLDPPLVQELGSLTRALREGFLDQGIRSFLAKLSASEDFLFSPTPEEEQQWRRLLCWSLLTAAPSGCELPSKASLVATTPACQDYDFAERLEQAYEFLKAGQSPRMLKHLERLKSELCTFVEAQETLLDERQEVLDRLSRSIKDRSIDLDLEHLIHLLEVEMLGQSAPDRLGFPSSFLFASEAWEQVCSLEEESFLKLSDLATDLPPEVAGLWTESFLGWRHLRSHQREFLSDWQRLGGHESFGWMARRQLLDVLTSQYRSFDWFRSEVLPYQPSQSSESLKTQTQEYASRIILNESSLSLKIQAVDFLRNVTSALLLGDTDPGEALAAAPLLPSVKNREEALSAAVAPFHRLIRRFHSAATEDVALEQIVGLNSRLGFERLKCLFLTDSESLKGALEREQVDTLSQAESLPAAEFFARWDLLERRADLVASVELTKSLDDRRTHSSRLFSLWVHSISSSSEPSVFGSFLGRLPQDINVEDLVSLREDISRIETGNPRVGALLARWSARLEKLEHSREFLGEPSLNLYEKSLVVGTLATRQDSSLSAANRVDDVLQALATGKAEELQKAYESAHGRLQEVFLALDLTGVGQELKDRLELISLLGKRPDWERSLSEFAPRIWAIFPRQAGVSEAEHLELLHALPLIVGQAKHSPSYWHMPSVLVGLGENILTALVQSEKSEVEKWQVAILNAAGRCGLPRRPFEESFQQLNTALRNHDQATAVLRSKAAKIQEPQITPALLLCLKVSADMFSGQVDSNAVSTWLVGAIQRTASIDPLTLVKSVKDLLLEWSLGSYPEEVKEGARGIRLRLESASGESANLDEMMERLQSLSSKTDSDLDKSRSWFSKISDSFEAVVRR